MPFCATRKWRVIWIRMRRTDLRLVAVTAFSLWTTGTGAQDLVIPEVGYPVLPARGAGADAFAPPGWRVERQAQGDLNGDGEADLAFVLRMRDPANVVRHDSLGINPLDTNPRILGVALGVSPGNYRLVVQDRVLIPRHEYPNLSDPFGEEDSRFEIERGALHLSLYRFANAGGWDMGTTGFTFRWQQGALRLIGYDFTNVRRNSGCATSLSVNYPTRRARLSAGTIDSDAEQVRWRRLSAQPLRAIETIGDGLAFDPEGLVSGFPLDCAERGDD